MQDSSGFSEPSRPGGRSKTTPLCGVVVYYIVLNIYSFALTVTANSLHPVILPVLVREMAPRVWKATYLGFLTFSGLVVPIVVQPVKGALSDRSTTNLVPPGEAARYMGITNLATAGGSAIARLGGPVVDIFNARRAGLGYTVPLLAINGLCFLLATLAILRVRGGRKGSGLGPPTR